jgi:hypothetical protein
MKLPLDTNSVSRIKEILENTTSKHEIEFRLGKYKNNRFIPGVSKIIFNNLLSSLSKKYKYETNKSTVNYYDNNIRDIDGVFQKKIKISNIDILFSDIDIRFSKSIEEHVNGNKNGEIKFTRERTRYTFVFDYYNIDLTIIDGATYEVELEFTTSQLDINKVVYPLRFVLELVFPHKISLISENEFIDVTNKYNKLFEGYIRNKHITIPHGKIVRFENKPRNIKRNDIQYMNNYSVTNKLNGIGMFLMIAGGGIYIINQTDIDVLSRNNKPINEYIGTLFHGEWFENGFYIFDVLKYRGTDVTMNTHPQRLKYAEKIIPLLSPVLLDSKITIEIKTFICSGNIERDICDIMREMYNKYESRALEKNDGIMFTPVDLPYINKDTLKFKFPSTMTIDFYIDNKNQYTDKTIFDIKVYDKNNNNILFNPVNGYNLNLTVYNDDKLYYILDTGMIVESLYDKEKKTFYPLRIRYDKTTPNFISVANDVFNDIINPIELDTLVKLLHDKYNSSSGGRGKLYLEECLKGGDERKGDERKGDERKGDERKGDERKGDERKDDNCLSGMRKYNNIIKRDLIMEYAKEKKVLDLGFGYGGDIHKYSDANVKFVWGVEPNIDNYTEAKNRISKKYSMKNKVKIIHLKAQDSGDIFDNMKDSKNKDQKGDIVSLFFSLTFFFENENELDRLINTIAQGVKIGGYLIGATMDGQSTYEYLKDVKNKGITDCFEINKYYEDNDKIGFGKKIKINLKDTIVKDQFEWLVDFDIFVDKLDKRGLKLIKTTIFDPPSYVDTDIVDFNKLFRSFVFERYETESEQNIKKKAEKNKELLILERKNVLPSAPLDKTLAFDNNFDDTTQLVRTGTVGDGSCMFHSVLRAIDPNYIKLTPKEREEFVSKLRKKMSNDFSREEYLNLGGGSLAYMQVIPHFTNHIIDKYPDTIENISANNLNEYITILRENVHEDEILNILNKHIDKYFNIFKDTLKDCKAWVGQEVGSVDAFEYVSNKFNIDIYLIRDSTRKPYKSGTDCSTRFKNRKSILILWVGNSHYEVIGRLESNKKTVTRIFNSTDPLIKKINSIVCD